MSMQVRTARYMFFGVLVMISGTAKAAPNLEEYLLYDTTRSITEYEEPTGLTRVLRDTALLPFQFLTHPFATLRNRPITSSLWTFVVTCIYLGVTPMEVVEALKEPKKTFKGQLEIVSDIYNLITDFGSDDLKESLAKLLSFGSKE